ncbi:hypothetical protein [Streptomyces gilvus]|uniref:hypothetical protein n=1 Tax=Streptomyces gilvus TaxID=2920937 RepID=UPI001F0F472B|nr:hypothetical protein [Streptomyces sp. CME 23]MCH5671013.1 hypothetical protein [Streptomyces sp. CME 23]
MGGEFRTMPMFGRRERREEAFGDTRGAASRAFAISDEDLRTLERVTSHARTQLLRLSDSDLETIDNGSGYRLMPLMYQRAGAARVLGHSGVPMLVTEVSNVHAAVLNLESYQGDPVLVLEGYDLLNRLTLLAELAHAPEEIAGVVTLPNETPGAPAHR